MTLITMEEENDKLNIKKQEPRKRVTYFYVSPI